MLEVGLVPTTGLAGSTLHHPHPFHHGFRSMCHPVSEGRMRRQGRGRGERPDEGRDMVGGGGEA